MSFILRSKPFPSCFRLYLGRDEKLHSAGRILLSFTQFHPALKTTLSRSYSNTILPMSGSAFSATKLFDLTGTVALVTGGGSGIGLMITQGLAANGAKVYITGRRAELLQKVSDAWTGDVGKIVALPMDVTSKESIMAGKKVIQEQEGKLHILVNNAGQVGPCSPFFNKLDAPEHQSTETLGQALFDNESFEQWSDLYKINTFSIFFTSTAFLGLLEKGTIDRRKLQRQFTAGIINITSMSALMSQAQDHFGYNSGKAATSHLTRLLATEIALKKIPVRVNAVAPGSYESEMTGPIVDVDSCAKGVSPVPAGRVGSAEEMAATIVYLASAGGGYANGQEICIDGGFTAVNP